MPLLTARVAQPTDRDSLQRLINTAFSVERPFKRDAGDRLHENGREMDALLARGVFLVLEEADSLAAAVYLEPRGNRCYLGLLSVSPEQKGRGLGRRMMAAAEDFARERGCSHLDLRVISPRRDELVPLYLRFGYNEQGTQEYPADLAAELVHPGHFILMAKQISP